MKRKDPVILERRRVLAREREFSAFTKEALDTIDRCVREKHSWGTLCQKDLSTLSEAERREVNSVIHKRVDRIRRAIYLGEEE